MGILRRQKGGADAQFEASLEPQMPRHRQNGPWDISERKPDGDAAYVDFGPLILRGRPGMEIRLQGDQNNTGRIPAALVVGRNEAMELRVFAGPRSGGQWNEVVSDIIAEVKRVEGTYNESDGPFGKEIHARVPVKMEDGKSGVQPSRIIGIDGPRWMLRATLLGQAALEPTDHGDLMDVLRDVIVERGAEAMAAREPLYLTAPETDLAPGAEDPGAEDPAESTSEAAE